MSTPRSRAQRRVARGRRHLLAGVSLLVALIAMTLGPLQSYTAAADRVDALAASRQRLQVEVDRLEDQRRRLNDPDEVEVLARAELGLVKPGEVPYVVAGPEPGLDQVGLDPQAPPPVDLPWYRSWYRRLARSVADLLGGQPEGAGPAR